MSLIIIKKIILYCICYNLIVDRFNIQTGNINIIDVSTNGIAISVLV